MIRVSPTRSEIAAVDTVVSMSAIANPGLKAKAEEIGGDLTL